MSSDPIFVIGMNGSGTTMLADSLGHHPSVYSMPIESKVLPYYLYSAGSFGDLTSNVDRRRFANALGKEMPFWQANGQQELVLEDEIVTGCETPGDIICAIFDNLMRKAGKQRWCDKSPVNTQHVRLLGEAFPTARFVHIIRDGREAAQSFHRRWGRHPLHTIFRWREMIVSARAQAQELGSDRYFEVFYEKLTTDAAGVMRDVCRFLGLPFVDAVLCSSMQYMNKADAKAGANQIVPNSNKWRSYFSEMDIAEMERISGSLLVELGYGAKLSGSVRPWWVVRQYWRLRDRLAFTHWYFGEYGMGALWMYFRLARASRKQGSVGEM